MKQIFVISSALAITFAFAAPAEAKKPAKAKGVYCEQGGQNAFIPISQLPAKSRSKVIKGKKYRFNYPGFGPITCYGY